MGKLGSGGPVLLPAFGFSEDFGCSIPGEETDHFQKIVHLDWSHSVGGAQPGKWRQGSSGNQGSLGDTDGKWSWPRIPKQDQPRDRPKV